MTIDKIDMIRVRGVVKMVLVMARATSLELSAME
jgi:hypothetical protein